jgi:hypothetical protein
MDGPACQVADYRHKIQEGMWHFALAAQANECWRTFQGIIEGSKEGLGCWQDTGRMLQVTCD